MAITDTCSPCNCLGGYVDKEAYRSSVITLLCKLAENTPSGIFYDYEILCEAASNTPKVVRYKYTAGSTTITAEAYNLDGTPYTGSVSDLKSCSAKDMEMVVLYDFYDWVFHPFIRMYNKNPNTGVVTTNDLSLDGTAYTIIGRVTDVSETLQSKLSEIETGARRSTNIKILYDTYTSGSETITTSFMRVYVHDFNGDPIGNMPYDKELDGRTSYTVQGTVTPYHPGQVVNAILMED